MKPKKKKKHLVYFFFCCFSEHIPTGWPTRGLLAPELDRQSERSSKNKSHTKDTLLVFAITCLFEDTYLQSIFLCLEKKISPARKLILSKSLIKCFVFSDMKV